MRLLLIVSILLFSGVAKADWSWGLGYHNPPGATVGVNFMHLWRNWALELGVGYIGSNEYANNKANDNKNNPAASDSDRVTYTVAGDVNLKYLFSSGFVRPYLQGGVGTYVSTTSSGAIGAGASLSHPFGGAGLFFMGRSMYLYVSYLFINQSTFQAGIGF
jgi:hypothetical protein